MIVLITVTTILSIVTTMIIIMIGQPWHQHLPPAPPLASRASSGGPRGLGRPSRPSTSTRQAYIYIYIYIMCIYIYIYIHIHICMCCVT